MRKKVKPIIRIVRDTHLVLKVVDCSDRLISKIKNRFTISNPKFYKLQRLGMPVWNVDKQIISYKLDEPFIALPRGAEKEVTTWIQDEGCSIKLIDKTTTGIGPDTKPPKLRFTGKARPYQGKAIKAVLDALNESSLTGCVFRGPCGSGKTFNILSLIYELQLPTIVIVHTDALARQWNENIARWFGFAPGRIGGGKKDDIKPITVAMQQTLWRRAKQEKKPEWIDSFGLVAVDECFEARTPILMADGTRKEIKDICVGDDVAVGGRVKHLFKRSYSGEMYMLNGFLVTPNHPISTKDNWVPVSDLHGSDIPGVEIQKANKTVTNYPVFNFETENNVYVAAGVLVHNCHRVASKTFQIVSEMFPAKYRIGASADERRKDRLEILVTDALGPLVHEIKKKDLIGYGNLVPTRLEVVKTHYFDGIFLDSANDKTEVGLDWTGMINRMVADEKRNNVILQKIVQVLETDKNARILCLSERVDVCYYYADEINEHTNLVAGVMVGGPENRAQLEKTMAGLQTGEIRIGFGTSVADEGLDIPALTHVFLTCPVHGHPKRMVQMIGRAARPWPNKKEAVAVYFWDEEIFPILEESASLIDIEYQRGKFLRKLERSTEVCSVSIE